MFVSSESLYPRTPNLSNLCREILAQILYFFITEGSTGAKQLKRDPQSAGLP